MEKNIIDSTTSKKPVSRSTAFKAKVTHPVKPKPYSTFNFQDHLDQYTIKVQQMLQTSLELKLPTFKIEEIANYSAAIAEGVNKDFDFGNVKSNSNFQVPFLTLLCNYDKINELLVLLRVEDTPLNKEIKEKESKALLALSIRIRTFWVKFNTLHVAYNFAPFKYRYVVDWANYIIDDFAKTNFRLAKKPKTDTYPAITFETTVKVIINKLVEADKQMKTNMISLHRAYNLTEFGMNEDLSHMLHGLYPFTQPGNIHPDWVYIHALILYKSSCFDASQLKQFDSYLHEINLFNNYDKNLMIVYISFIRNIIYLFCKKRISFST